MKKRKGFTLLEVIAVMIIMGIVTASNLPRLDKMMDTPAFEKIQYDFKLYEIAAINVSNAGLEITPETISTQLSEKLRFENNKSIGLNPFKIRYDIEVLGEDSIRITSKGQNGEIEASVTIQKSGKEVISEYYFK